MIFFLVSHAHFKDISKTSVSSLDFDIRVLTKNNGWFALKSVFLLLGEPVVLFPWSAVGLKALLLRPNTCRNASQCCVIVWSKGFRSSQAEDPWKGRRGVQRSIFFFFLFYSFWCWEVLSRHGNSSDHLLSLLPVQDEWGSFKLYNVGKGGGAMGVHFLESKETVLDDSGATINGPPHFLPLPPPRCVYLSAKRR